MFLKFNALYCSYYFFKKKITDFIIREFSKKKKLKIISARRHLS